MCGFSGHLSISQIKQSEDPPSNRGLSISREGILEGILEGRSEGYSVGSNEALITGNGVPMDTYILT